MIRIQYGLQVRLVITLVVVTLIGLAANDLLVYWEIRSRMDRELGDSLSRVAVSLATQIDGALVYALTPGTEDSRTHKNLQARLERFLSRTRLRNAYLLDQDGRSLLDARGEVPTGMLRPHLMYERLELETVFEGVPTSSVLFQGYDDQFYKSGFAPVFYRGRVVAAVGVDAGATYLQSVEELGRTMWGLGMLCLALAALAGMLFANQLVRPLRRLVSFARGIGSGNLHTPVAMQRDDEIGILGHTMEQMRLDILERDAQLKTMLASVAHEIRNPLAGIELFAEIMHADQQQGEESHSQAERILREVRTLKETLNNFLEYARPSDPEPQSVSISETLHELRPFLQKDLDAKHVSLVFPLESADLHVYCDARHLTEIFMNLLANAVRAVPQDGRITVTAESKNGHHYLRVSDNGPGIDATSVSKIFNPFYTTRENGTGLGLAIARKLAETNHGGLCYDAHTGMGAEFILTLPVEPRA